MNNQPKILAALIVEDVESDAQLIVRLLRKAGYKLAYEQVETARQMRAALEKRTWDIIISDYSLPQFSGEGALAILKESGLDIPFIIVSGTMGEETAVAMMKAGTQDYLMKDNLVRLIPAVERELEQAEIRRERRKVQEQLLLQSSALNAAANAIVIADHEGTIEWVNPAFNTLTGYTSEEAIGKNPRDLVKSGSHDRSFYQNMWDTILAGKVWRGELINRHKDGSLYTEEETITPLKNANGTISHFIGIKQDISERKQSDKALAASEAELRALFASMRDVVLVIDRGGLYLKIAPTNQSLLVKPPEELLGKNLRDVFPAEQADFFIDTVQQVLDTKQTAQIEYKLLIGDRTVWFETSISPMDMDSTLWVARDITERKQAGENIHQRVKELEMLYESGLALSQLLNPKEIGQKILELLEEKLDWHHTRIRLYHPQDDRLELLDFNQPGLKGEAKRNEVVEYFQTLIAHSGQGMSGWVIQHGQPVRSGDVSNDPRYVEAYPGMHSGLYVPMKLGERIVGVISIEDEQPHAFSEADERLIATLANQAASAFENARLFEETRQRVMELETLNRISLVLRSVSKQNEMLTIVLDEALAILNTLHGSISLYNKATDTLEKTITRGWTAQVTELPQKSNEGIAGKVFSCGEIYISQEFASDPETRAVSRSQVPPNWGGACLPIRTSQNTLGVMIVSVPSERKLNKDEIRLLSILSEMTGAALQRMQLHEQTVRRLEQLNALRAVDQAISSSRDMHLTFNILLTHTLSQLNVDAADVLLFYPGSNMLELAAGQGFHTLLAESTNLSDSFAGRTIAEHHSIMMVDFETAKQNPQFGKLWKEEGFICYWCVPLIIKGEVKGVLEVYCRKAFTPDAEWIEFFEALAGQAAIAIDNTQLFENLQRANMDLGLAYDATIEGWSRAMDLRDHETEGHTLRVTDLTMKLARAMRVSESQLTAIRRGALLHDIGKMGVPDAILLKEGILTDEEWMVMRKHPILARDMLIPIAYLNDALNIPYCHHEKWDGTGYPQGLKGDHIPLSARIFAVVDVWDALTNDRTYRTRWTKQKARQYIKEQRGKHFDPQVVDIFLKNIGKSWI